MVEPGTKPCGKAASLSFHGGAKADDEDDGVSSPPLWRTSPHHPRTNYRSLSPESKAQAIARGQKELMEMVRNMPESCYELSLKDLVEMPRPLDAFPDPPGAGDPRRRAQRRKKGGGAGRPQRMTRSGSVNNGGFLLKMVFPVSVGLMEKKKNGSGTNVSAKVSPRPPVSDGSAKAVDKEWWKKRFSVAEEIDGRGPSSNTGSTKSSSSSSSSSRHGSESSCWSFIRAKGAKMTE